MKVGEILDVVASIPNHANVEMLVCDGEDNWDCLERLELNDYSPDECELVVTLAEGYRVVYDKYSGYGFYLFGKLYDTVYDTTEIEYDRLYPKVRLSYGKYLDSGFNLATKSEYDCMVEFLLIEKCKYDAKKYHEYSHTLFNSLYNKVNGITTPEKVQEAYNKYWDSDFNVDVKMQYSCMMEFLLAEKS